MYSEDDSSNQIFKIYEKFHASGTLPIAPQGTIALDDVVDDNSETQQKNIERALFLYFVENNESSEDEDSDVDTYEGDSP